MSRTRTGQGPGQDQDELNSKMSVGMEVMSVMNRADNTGAKNLEHHDREEHVNPL